MSTHYGLAVIGYPGSTLLYKAAGAEVFPVNDALEARNVAEQIALPSLKHSESVKYAVVFVEDVFYYQFPRDLIERFARRPLPAVIPVPSGAQGGKSHNRLKELVEKAVGSDILG